MQPGGARRFRDAPGQKVRYPSMAKTGKKTKLDELEDRIKLNILSAAAQLPLPAPPKTEEILIGYYSLFIPKSRAILLKNVSC